jgi:hypothetical protein
MGADYSKMILARGLLAELPGPDREARPISCISKGLSLRHRAGRATFRMLSVFAESERNCKPPPVPHTAVCKCR